MVKFNEMDWPQEHYPKVMRNFCLVPVVVMLHNQDRKEKSMWVYNAAAVIRQMATGRVHRYLEEVLTTLNVPSLTKQLFTKASFKQLLLELMVKTRREEKHIAK